MNAVKTLIAASVATFALTADIAHAWDGSVTLYEDIYFAGKPVTITFGASQRCFNVGCFNDRASSASWNNLIQTGNYNGLSYIVFYTDVDCTGNYKAWPTNGAFPNNFVVDGLNDAVTSFMVWENSGFATQGYKLVCNWSPLAESGLLGNGASASASATTSATTSGMVIDTNAIALSPANGTALRSHAEEPKLQVAVGHL